MNNIDDYIYKINVSGKVYNIKHKILIKIPYFNEYINEFNNNDKLICFIERSSMIFDHVLACVIDPLHPYPSKYFYELDFYGLKYEKKIYKVNVLGRIYYLKSNILMRIPYFANIIKEMDNSSIEIYVDRSPLLFDEVLAYIMNVSYSLESSEELDFYGIIYNKNDLIKNNMNIIKETLQNEMSDIKDHLVLIEDNIEEKLDFDNIKVCQYEGCKNFFKDDFLCCDHHHTCRYCHRISFRSENYCCSDHRR